jgi:hypothetical protein
MEMKMRIGQIITAVLWLYVASIAWSNVHAGNIKFNTTAGIMEFNLVDPIERAKFLEYQQADPMISSCIGKANYAVTIMEERDAGVTREEQLEKVRARYEKTKLEPQGSVPWHVYMDFERMVRDIYRDAGASAKSQYRNTDPNILWDHEFQWCAIK